MLSSAITSFFLFFQTAFASIGPFVLLLGLLIFIHELGHFLIARWCGVTVEVFSLGFGPKILKYRRGDTLYCVSLLPLGGYVKMFGDSLTEKPPEAERHRGFLYQKVSRKLAIAFGGPLMNLLFAFVVFFSLALVGIPALSPEIGDIREDTKAWRAGFRPGDKILSLNGRPVNHWEDVRRTVKKSSGETLKFKVLSGLEEKNLSVSVASQKNQNIFELRKEVGHIEGLTPLSLGTKVGIVSPETPPGRSGLRIFDQITHIGGQEVRYWREMESVFKRAQFPLAVKVKREGLKGKGEAEVFNFTLPVPEQKTGTLKDFGLERAVLYLYRVGPKTPAEKAGLKPKDRLVAVNGKKLNTWEDVLTEIQSQTGKLTLSYRRDGREHETDIVPEKMFVEGNLKEKRMIGIAPVDFSVFPPESVKKYSLAGSMKYAVLQTGYGVKGMALGLFHIIKGTVSPRNISGPVAIGRIAHRYFHTGFYHFLSVMALISLSLFFFNILPIPLLDGGHILFFSIEGIRGRPLDVKKLLAAQQAGLFLILVFFSFVFFNDILNWLNAW